MSSKYYLLRNMVRLGCILCVIVPAGDAAAVLPGSPMNGGNFGTLDIMFGGNLLPSLVVPGDVILRENPTGGDLSGNWSDVVRFTNVQTVAGPVGVAFLISDSEAGISNIGVLPLLPNTLSSNNLLINEIQTGTGTDQDVTVYSATGATYNIHSDAALNELPPGTVTIDPGAPLDGMNHAFMVVEVGINIPAEQLGFLAQTGGPVNVPEPGGGPPSDILNFANIGGNISVTGSSDSPSAEAGPEQTDVEILNAVNGAPGDESSFASYFVAGADVPEPSSLLLFGSGILTMSAILLRRKRAARRLSNPPESR